MTYRIEFTAAPSEADVGVVSAGLLEPDAEQGRKSPYVPLAFFVRAHSGDVLGGVVGNTGGAWLYVSALWVTPRLRGQGFGTRLMECAEAEGVRRGCTGAYLDTLSRRALAFYRARGYECFGELEGFPDQQVRHFLCKSLVRQPA